jgi:CRISPR-associated protein Cas5d
MDPYSVSLEVSGKTAIFTRPDTGSSPISYPVPTYSALRGIFEAILLLEQASVVPVKVEICAPINYHHYTTNYLGPAKKTGQEGALQVPATVLTDVCYRVYARAYHDDRPIPYSTRGKPNGSRCTHGGHAYREIFNRRIKRGQCYRTPFLGWKEFTVDYFGPFRPDTKVQEDIDLFIPCLFKAFSMDGLGKSTTWQPIFMNNVEVREGVLHYV